MEDELIGLKRHGDHENHEHWPQSKQQSTDTGKADNACRRVAPRTNDGSGGANPASAQHDKTNNKQNHRRRSAQRAAQKQTDMEEEQTECENESAQGAIQHDIAKWLDSLRHRLFPASAFKLADSCERTILGLSVFISVFALNLVTGLRDYITMNSTIVPVHHHAAILNRPFTDRPARVPRGPVAMD